MGIESDRLVLDYLSRVGDLAQTALPAAERMRLVAQLRNDIDRARERTAGDSPAAVRRILGRLGSPDELVESASASSAAAPPPSAYTAPVPPMPAAPAPSAPARSAPAPEAPGGGDGPQVPGQPAGPPGDAAGPSVNDLLAKRPAGPGAAAGEAAGGEWWRPSAPQGGSRANEVLGGWTGGLIMSEFEPPAAPPPPGAPPVDPAAAAAAPAAPAPGAPARGRLRIPRIRLRPAPAAAGSGTPARRGIPTGPVEVLAAALLVAGAVLANLILLLAGWLLAYTTRGITRKQASFATLVLPGTVVVGGLVWLWGRTTGHWGAKLSQAQMGTALTADFPVILRVAAGASAAYLVWRGVVRRG